MEPVTTLRPCVRRFAEAMERELRANDHKDGWDFEPPLVLLVRLREETRELARELRKRDVMYSWDARVDAMSARIAAEAADVANFAMMIADVCGGLSAQRPQSPVGTEPSPAADRNPTEAPKE